MGRLRDDQDAAQNVARGLTDLAARFEPLMREAAGWLGAERYEALRLRLTQAHVATKVAAAEARRNVLLNEGRDRRGRWTTYSELRRLREERGLTQWELAGLSGVSRTTIHRIENDEQRPRWSTLSKLAHVLDVEPEWIWWSPTYDPVESAVGVRVTQKIRDETRPHIERAARKYARKYGLGPDDIPDLEGAGEAGMLKACYTFDSSIGTDLSWWARLKAVHGVHDEAKRLHKQLRPGPSVDYLESQGVEVFYNESDE